MKASIVLTVAQSKRLIARAVVKMPEVRYALTEGMIAIGRGTTDAYVAEEILKHPIPKGEYVAGRTLPSGIPATAFGTMKYPDIVVKNGERVLDMTIAQAVQEMKAGDVFIKGANALNYREKVAGVLISHPSGGTCGENYGTIVSRKINLIIPIGLEKLVYEDMTTLSRLGRDPEVHPEAEAPSLYPLSGTIVTEIEALNILFDLKATLYASGGVAGAEGAVWLLIEGEKHDIDRVLLMMDELKSEPNLGLTTK